MMAQESTNAEVNMLDKPVLPPVTTPLSPSERKKRTSSVKAIGKAVKRGSLVDFRKAVSSLTTEDTLENERDLSVLSAVDESFETACSNDKAKIVQWLLQMGADPLQPLGHSALPALLIAAKSGSLNVLRMLIREKHCNAEVVCKRTGSTALHVAAEAPYNTQNYNCCEWLLDHIDVNTKRSSDNATALHLASRAGKDKIVKMLLDNDADPYLYAHNINHDGKDWLPLQLAHQGKSLLKSLNQMRTVAHLTKAASIHAKDRVSGEDEACPDVDGVSLKSHAPRATSASLDAASIRLQQSCDAAPESDVVRVPVPAESLETALEDERAAREALKEAQRRAREAKRVAKSLRRSQSGYGVSLKRSLSVGGNSARSTPVYPQRSAESDDGDGMRPRRGSHDRRAHADPPTRGAVSPVDEDPVLASLAHKLSKGVITREEYDHVRRIHNRGTACGDDAGCGTREESTDAGHVLVRGAPPAKVPTKPRSHSARSEVSTDSTVSTRSDRSAASSASEGEPKSRTRKGSHRRSKKIRPENSCVATGAAGDTEALGNATERPASTAHRRRSTSLSVAMEKLDMFSETDRAISTGARGGTPAEPSGTGEGVAMIEACTVCGTMCDIQLCVQCLSVGYCSRQCQKVDWKRHKHECRAHAS
eukprot:m.1116004 g.1116004  ORF g.1116004 m.1116004 type:complete len:650 (-) comp24373_c0_seq13:143-2092(-)